MTSEDNPRKCAHCRTVEPVGGLTSHPRERWIINDRPQLERVVLLCEVCANTLATNEYLRTGSSEHDARDRAWIANLIRKDIAALARPKD